MLIPLLLTGAGGYLLWHQNRVRFARRNQARWGAEYERRADNLRTLKDILFSWYGARGITSPVGFSNINDLWLHFCSLRDWRPFAQSRYVHECVVTGVVPTPVESEQLHLLQQFLSSLPMSLGPTTPAK